MTNTHTTNGRGVSAAQNSYLYNHPCPDCGGPVYAEYSPAEIEYGDYITSPAMTFCECSECNWSKLIEHK